MDWVTVVTSAAVGSLSASIASLVGAAQERRARKRELLLSKAVELAEYRYDKCIELAVKKGMGFTLTDPAAHVDTYYDWLRHAFEKGEPHPDALSAKNKSLGQAASVSVDTDVLLNARQFR